MTSTLPAETPLTIVSDRMPYVYAALAHGQAHDHLSVIVSARTRDDQPWMAPVGDLLDSRCYSWVSATRRKDPTMLGGESTEWEYHLYPECPENAEPFHVCADPGFGRDSRTPEPRYIPSH